jgi:hypothetical protein
VNAGRKNGSEATMMGWKKSQVFGDTLYHQFGIDESW